MTVRDSQFYAGIVGIYANDLNFTLENSLVDVNPIEFNPSLSTTGIDAGNGLIDILGTTIIVRSVNGHASGIVSFSANTSAYNLVVDVTSTGTGAAIALQTLYSPATINMLSSYLTVAGDNASIAVAGPPGSIIINSSTCTLDGRTVICPYSSI